MTTAQKERTNQTDQAERATLDEPLLDTGRHGTVFGLAGWSGAGKTTLVEKLISHLVSLGLNVATIKHAHHHFDADTPGKDSYRHRAAGARQVLVSSAKRAALFSEHGEVDKPNEPNEPNEPGLDVLLARLDPADIVIVEGFKAFAIRKIEIYRAAVGKPLLHPHDPHILAVASDAPLADCPLPCFDLDDIAAIAAFIGDQAQTIKT